MCHRNRKFPTGEVPRTRMTHVKMCVQTKMRIKSLLYVKGIRYPDTFENRSTHWSRNFVSWIENEASSLPYEGGRSLLIQIENLRFIHNQILKATRELRKIMTQPLISRFIQAFDVHSGHRVSYRRHLPIGGRWTSQDSQATIIWHHLWVLSPDTRSTWGKGYLQSGSPHEANPPSTNHVYRKRMVCDTTGSGLTLAYTKLVSRMEPNKAIIRIGRKLPQQSRMCPQNTKSRMSGCRTIKNFLLTTSI